MQTSPSLTIAPLPDGNLRVTRWEGDLDVSRLTIVPFVLRIGLARVRMDGIAAVGTLDSHRKRGLSTEVLNAAMQQMKSGDAALSMLYGIPNFYPRWGFTTAGPHFFLHLDKPDQAQDLGPWRFSPLQPHHVEQVLAFHEAVTPDAVGAAVRDQSRAGGKLLTECAAAGSEDACRLLWDPEGILRGYAWLTRTQWSARQLARRAPTSWVVGEALADSPEAGDRLLTAIQNWSLEPPGAPGFGPEPERTDLVLAIPPQGHLVSAARRRGGRLQEQYFACGESMARVLSLPRLLQQLQPELERRCLDGGLSPGTWTIRCGSEATAIQVSEGHLRIVPPQPAGRQFDFPQTALARLALGAVDPTEELAYLPRLNPSVRELLVRLFPRQYPHMYLADRY